MNGAQADIRAPSGSPSAGDGVREKQRATKRYSAADVARFARKNRMHSSGGKALVILLAWVLAPQSRRGRYLTPLGQAARQMLAEGVEPPTARQVTNAIEAVMTGEPRAKVDRTRKR